MSSTGVSASYSTSTASAPSFARPRVSASTTATPSPWNRALSEVSGQWSDVLMSSVIGQTIGSGPAHSCARSAAVQAPVTPGISSALLTSTLTTFAWAKGLRTTARCTMPGRIMLSTKLPCPRSSDASSLRRTGCPTTFSVTAISAPLCLRPGRLAGGIEDRLHDVVIAGATAQVPLERVANLLLRRARVLLQVARRGHHHPGRAEPALQPVAATEGILDRVQFSVGGEPLDRGDLAPVGLRGEQRARFHRLAVAQDGARAARGGVAPDVGTGEAERLPEEVHEERPRFDVRLASDPVDGDRHVGQGSPLSERVDPRC